MLSHKGSLTAQAVKWAIPTLAFLIVAIATMNFLSNRYSSVDLDTTAVHAQQMAWRGLDALAYEDPVTHLAKPLVIDAEKIDESLLERTIVYPEQRYSAKFSIGPNIVYFSKQLYDRLLPLKGIQGPGGVRSYTFSYPITIITKEESQSSIAHVEVLAIQ